MNCQSIVRRAVVADYDGVWELFRLLHAENAMLSMSKPKIDWMLDRIFRCDQLPPTDMGLRGYMGVIGPVGGQLEGFILLTISSFWYSDDLILEEYANFVHPSHRKSNHAKTLVGYAKYLSDRISIPLLIGIISNTRTAAKVRLYRRQLPEVGAFFYYRGINGQGHHQPTAD